MLTSIWKIFLKGTAREKFRRTNERVIPWNTATVCNAIEGIKPYNPLVRPPLFRMAVYRRTRL